MAKPHWAKKFSRPKTTYIGDDGQRRTFKLSDITNHPKECVGGCMFGEPRRHDSGEEAMFCNKLNAQMKQGEFLEIDSQVMMYLKDALGKPCGYCRVDWLVTLPDKKQRVYSYKGQRTREDDLKAALFTWNYPEIEYRTVTQKDLL